MNEKHVVALSGGKDSTALALRLRELNPQQEYVYLCTPTGDELPEMLAHWSRLESILGHKILRITNGTLRSWIDGQQALPNWRQRWCTRVLKIQPCIAYFKSLPPSSVLYVGLRADEELRRGIYSNDIATRFPLREWGWGLGEVKAYLREQGVAIPRRTDCARCYGQRLSEWYDLWRDHPEVYAEAMRDEAAIGKTYRSPGRDSWPAGLAALAECFGRGEIPKGHRTPLPFDDDDDAQSCRVCRI